MRPALMLAALAMLAGLFVPGAAAGASAPAHPAKNGIAAGMVRSVESRIAWVKANGLPPSDPSIVDCTVSSPDTSNVNLDCDDPGYPHDAFAPNNEENVVVDPADPRHVIISSNDYSSCCDEFYTTFDGGRTWTTGDMSHGTDATGSDPVTAIDPVHGTAVHASLNYTFNEEGEACNGNVVVSIATDGGIEWDEPIVVYPGSGCDLDPTQVFNDKEWITVDANPSSPFYGRLYLTWSRFLSHEGEYVESPIWESHSDDGGYTWSTAHEISGTSPTFCTFQTGGGPDECDEDQASVPTIGPDGTVTVAFINEQHSAAWEPRETFENQYMVVMSQDGGTSWTHPIHVVDMEDGSTDLPLNVDGRQTLTGYQVRIWSVGNVTADPRSGQLFLVFSDNRNGIHDVKAPQSNMDVFLMRSSDGFTWSGPTQVTPGLSDEWFPWADVNPVSGQLGILYHGRSAADTSVYNTYVALMNGGAHVSTHRITNRTSRPRQSLWFRAGPGTPSCPHCATFFGDYIGMEYGSDGKANMSWTDMRRFLDIDGFSGYTENTFYSKE